MSKQGAANMVLASMLFLGVGMVLARGWLNDFETFVKSKVGGNPVKTSPTGVLSGGQGSIHPPNVGEAGLAQ